MRETRNQLSAFELLLGSDKVQCLCVQALLFPGHPLARCLHEVVSVV